MQEEDIQRALAQISNGDTAEAELLSALTKLKQFKAKWKQGTTAETKQRAVQVLSGAVVNEDYRLLLQAHAAAALAPIMEQECRRLIWAYKSQPGGSTGASALVLGEAVVEHLLRQIADVTSQPDRDYAQKKFLRVLAHSVKVKATCDHVVNKGGIEVVAGFLRRTPLAESRRERLRWATSCLWVIATDLTRIGALASCDLIPVLRDIFQVKPGQCLWAKANAGGIVHCMASTGIGASLLALVSLPTFMKDFIDTYARSNFASRFLAEALMSMAQHEATLMEVIREECLPTVWRYLLYHVRCKTEFPKRPDVLKVYHPRVTKLRAQVKSLVCCSVRGKDGHGFKPLLALTFMFMGTFEKREFFIDADGLSLFFKELQENNDSALTILTAFNCLVFGAEQIYSGTAIGPPALSPPQPAAAAPTTTTAHLPEYLAPIHRTVVQLGSFAVWRDDKSLHDVTFSFPYEDNQTVTAHKLLLAGRSAVFKAMFTLGMREAQRTSEALLTIPIPNMSPATFNLLLDFVYGVHLEAAAPPAQPAAAASASGSSAGGTQSTPAGGGQPGQRPLFANSSALDAAVDWLERSGVGTEGASALMAAAGQYEILDLEDACAIFLGGKVVASNVLALLREGLLHRSPVLIFRCFEFLLDNMWSLFMHNATAPTATTSTASTPQPAVAPATTSSSSSSSSGGGKQDKEEAAVADAPRLPPVTRALSPLVRGILLEADCLRWLRGFVERGMLGVPQVEFEVVTSAGPQSSGKVPGRPDGAKACCLQ